MMSSARRAISAMVLVAALAGLLASCGGLSESSTCSDWKSASVQDRVDFLKSQQVDDYEFFNLGCGLHPSDKLSDVVRNVCALRFCGAGANPTPPSEEGITSDKLEEMIRTEIGNTGGSVDSISCPDNQVFKVGETVDCDAKSGAAGDATLVVTLSGSPESTIITIDVK